MLCKLTHKVILASLAIELHLLCQCFNRKQQRRGGGGGGSMLSSWLKVHTLRLGWAGFVYSEELQVWLWSKTTPYFCSTLLSSCWSFYITAEQPALCLLRVNLSDYMQDPQGYVFSLGHTHSHTRQQRYNTPCKFLWLGFISLCEVAHKASGQLACYPKDQVTNLHSSSFIYSAPKSRA